MRDDCHVEPVQKTCTGKEAEQQSVVWLVVYGLRCPNCAARVRNSLLSVYGVVAAYVDHMAGTAKVTFNPELTTAQALVDAVAGAGNDGRHRYTAYYVA
ncbi:MAG: heavy-metal-associated domain-containing protein [Anaerolineae bacterium]|nr:heavy-metal-associated domain-containing protein [Anaerolineae bacterium]